MVLEEYVSATGAQNDEAGPKSRPETRRKAEPSVGIVKPPLPTIVTFVMLGGKVPESCVAELPDSGAASGTALARRTTQMRPSPQLGTLVHVSIVFEAAETLQPVATYWLPSGGGP